jgi:aminoglycoside phosphotransferase (APT) family kinase protein
MSATSADITLDLAALEGWLRHQLGEEGDVTDAARLGGGTQNGMVSFAFGGRALVVRCAPVSHARGLAREARTLAALATTNVPHPRLVATSDDASLLGGPFVVMEHVDGVDLTNPPGGAWSGPAGALGTLVIDALLELRSVDLNAAPLAGLRQPVHWLDEQLTRWVDLIDSYGDTGHDARASLPGIDDLSTWLAATKPDSWELGLVHGDMHLGNVLVDPGTGSVRAIVDWELCSLGDPLLDLGHLLVTWPGAGVVATSDGPPLASPPALLQRYQQLSSRDLAAVDWFKALAALRLAAILEGTYARSLVGDAEAAVGRHLHQLALRLVATGSSIATA